MATYVNDLRLKEISTGDESGTWGTSTNTNLELIGEALGYSTQQVFSSDADATTTIADGASDPARAMYFKITSAGSLTATRTCTIAPNTVSRVMFIENATTGSQSIAISQGSGANVTIATGKTAVVYLDGAGSGAAVVDAMAGVDPGVTDTLAEVLTAGNTTTTDQKIQFRDTGIYINSSADGQLDLVADTEIQIAATTIDVNGTLAFDSLKGTGATTVTNILDEDNMASDSATAIATQQSIKAYVDSQVGSFDTLAEVLAQGNTTGGTDLAVSAGDDITFTDTSKAIFGDGSDLQIYHSGTHSFIEDKGTGNLYIDGASSVVIRGETANTISAIFNDAGSVVLKHNGDTKLATTATGIDVTGTVTADGLTVDGDGSFTGSFEISGLSPKIFLSETDTTDLNTRLRNAVGKLQIQTVDDSDSNPVTRFQINHSTGDISFYEDTGTTPKFFWDASAERLGIGNSAPTTALDVTGTVTADGLTVDSTNNSGNTGTPTIVIKDLDTAVSAGQYTGAIEFETSDTGNPGINSYIRSVMTGSGGAGSFTFGTGFAGSLADRVLIDDNGDISFYEDTGTTPKLFWDSSAESLGIGTTSPEKPLHVNSGTGNIGVRVESSDATASIEFMDSGTTSTSTSARVGGISDDFFVQTNGVERLRIDASGNVGIGETDPSGYWAQANQLVIEDGNCGLTLKSAASGNGRLVFTNTKSTTAGLNDGGMISYSHADDVMIVQTSGSEAMRIDSSGNVGIGVVPSAWRSNYNVLQIGSGGSLTADTTNESRVFLQANTYVNASNVTSYLSTDEASQYWQNGGTHIFNVAPSGTADAAVTWTTAMTIDNAGNVGIGTSSPAIGGGRTYDVALTIDGGVSGGAEDTGALEVGGSTSVNDRLVGSISYFNRDNSGAGATTRRQVAIIEARSVTSDSNAGDDSGANLTFSTKSEGGSVAERMRLDASGNLLVGTTSATGASASGVAIDSNTSGGFISLAHPTGAATGRSYAVFRYNSTIIGNIAQSGTTAVLYNTTSDERLKENIADADDAGSKIDAIQVRKYDWKADGSHQDYGMVAQELLEVAPEAVHQPEDPEEMMGVDYSKLVPMMLKEIQSLRARIAALES